MPSSFKEGKKPSSSSDKLLHITEEDLEELYRLHFKSGKFKAHGDVDVVVVCVGEPSRELESAGVLRELWNLKLRAIPLNFLKTSEEVLEYCQKNDINRVVFLKSDEQGMLRILTWVSDRFQECKINVQDVTKYFKHQINNILSIALNRSENKVSANVNSANIASSSTARRKISFVLLNENEVPESCRQNLIDSMLTQMSYTIQKISNKVPIEVFAVSLDMIIIEAINTCVFIDEDEQDTQKSIRVLLDRYPHHGIYIARISEEMWKARNDKSGPVLFIYSLLERKYVVNIRTLLS